MINDVIGKRYAEAIYDIAAGKNQLKEVYEILEVVLESYERDKEFRDLINHPGLSVEAKKEILIKVFGKVLDEFSKTVLEYIVEKDRLIYIKSILKEYLKLYYLRNNIVEVEAIFAIEPNEVQRKKLIEKLEKMTAKKVELSIKTDKTIIGGGIIKIGDKIMDGSLKRQFEMLKSNL